MALQRECRQLLERLQELQGLVRQSCLSPQTTAACAGSCALQTSITLSVRRLCSIYSCCKAICKVHLHGKMNAAVQDAWPSSAGSPQILAGGLTREVSAASSELSTVADAEAEIRRLTQVGLPIPAPAFMGLYLSTTQKSFQLYLVLDRWSQAYNNGITVGNPSVWDTVQGISACLSEHLAQRPNNASWLWVTV